MLWYLAVIFGAFHPNLPLRIGGNCFCISCESFPGSPLDSLHLSAPLTKRKIDSILLDTLTQMAMMWISLQGSSITNTLEGTDHFRNPQVFQHSETVSRTYYRHPAYFHKFKSNFYSRFGLDLLQCFAFVQGRELWTIVLRMIFFC